MSTSGNGSGGNGHEVEQKGLNKTHVGGIGGNVSGSGPSPESEPGSVVAGKAAPPPGKLTKADFTSDQEVRWCPGCGDYAILTTCRR